MNTLNPLRAFLYCLCAGIAMIALALLLQPMKTESFLHQAFLSPLSTLSISNGLHTIVLLWSSMLLIGFGLFGLAGAAMLKMSSQRGAGRSENQDEENWYFL